MVKMNSISDSAVHELYIQRQKINDLSAMREWIGLVDLKNHSTARSYKKEVTRFRLFLETIHQSNKNRNPDYLLRDATEMDVALYEAQLFGKTRAGEAVRPLVVPAAILMKHGKAVDEQPFLDPASAMQPIESRESIRLKESSVKQAISILHAMYEHWKAPHPATRMSYACHNPTRRLMAAVTRKQHKTDRCFPLLAVQAMLLSARHRAERSSPEGQGKQIRRRWIAAMLFGLWGRRAEMAKLKMNDFIQGPLGTWRVAVDRKGGGEQHLPVAPWVMNELVIYRRHLGLPALPNPNENITAIQRLCGATLAKTVNPDLIYREVCQLARDAAHDLKSKEILPNIDELAREDIVRRLSRASPHWFRHSGASIAINSGLITLENASQMLGHSSPEITATLYVEPSHLAIGAGIEAIGHDLFACA